jgi:3-oxoacyl-[acyl-carrier-protein] synthase II
LWNENFKKCGPHAWFSFFFSFFPYDTSMLSFLAAQIKNSRGCVSQPPANALYQAINKRGFSLSQNRGAPIIAEYLGGALTCDAHHMTDPHPEGLGVSTCINLALKDGGIDRDAVNYINAHATSTLVGDKAEIKAIKKVFTGGLKGVKMNATKSMIGHGLGAAGGLEAVATIQAIRTGMVHPTINHENPIEEVHDLDVVANKKAEHKVTVGISNSFGFGGHNSVVAFGPYEGQ